MLGGKAALSLAIPSAAAPVINQLSMKEQKHYDVIIIGGSYAGLAAGMALGRSLRSVLIIDSGKPCNRQTPHSHNFLTHDGRPPAEIAAMARKQVLTYPTVTLLQDRASEAAKTEKGFTIATDGGEHFAAQKLIFASGVRDLMPDIPGFAECWGISVLHCPYCHGYEVRQQPTGILSNGDMGFEFAAMISNWTNDLTLYTNGPATFTEAQRKKLEAHGIRTDSRKILSLDHYRGDLQGINFESGEPAGPRALYARVPFEQHSGLPAALGCALTDDGFIKIDQMQQTTVPGVYACGDNTTRMRTVAGAVGSGTFTGAAVNRDIIMERFDR